MSLNRPPVTAIRLHEKHPLLAVPRLPWIQANPRSRRAFRAPGPLNLMTRLSAWPKRPGRAPPGIPVSGNRAVDAAFPVGRGLLRIEGAVAAGRHKGLFTAQAISMFCRPGFAKAHPAGASRGLNARAFRHVLHASPGTGPGLCHLLQPDREPAATAGRRLPAHAGISCSSGADVVTAEVRTQAFITSRYAHI
jgi:hypothetical protein